MERRELYTIVFIVSVNFLYFLITYSIFFAVVTEHDWMPYYYFSISETGWYPFSWLAEWFDFILLFRFSEYNQFKYLCDYGILGAAYFNWVGKVALFSRSLTATQLPFLKAFHYFALYIGILNTVFEIITVIFTMRLVSRYFGPIYASNIVFIFILLPLVWWVTICRWDMLPMAFTVCSLYFATENKPWLAWISLTVAVLTKIYPIIFGIPLLLYYLERESGKKALIYALSIIILAVLIYIPFLLFYGSYVILYTFESQSSRSFGPYTIWYWTYLSLWKNDLLFEISTLIQAGLICTYFLLDYLYGRKKKNAIADWALIRRYSVTVLLFLLTFKLAGYQYPIYAFPFVLIFANSFRRFVYFIFWITILNVTTYLTIIIYSFTYLSRTLEVAPVVYFLISMVYFALYTVAIVLIQFNKNPFENIIPILNEKDFMLELHKFVKKINK